MSLVLRYMRATDIREVCRIDHLCFDPPWSKDSYAFEIKESKISHMVVLEVRTLQAAAVLPGEESWLKRFNGWLRPEGRAAVAPSSLIVGYGGLWIIDCEAHISTLATHPGQRGRGYGEILLAGMFYKALRLKADYLVLEVRVSNAVAQNLYCKYGFRRCGRKRNYYRNKEDAFDMRVTLDAGRRRRFGQQYQRLQRSSRFDDDFSLAGRSRR